MLREKRTCATPRKGRRPASVLSGSWSGLLGAESASAAPQHGMPAMSKSDANRRLNQHPANQFAATCLGQLKEALYPDYPYLLQLAMVWMEQQSEPSANLADTLQFAGELLGMHPATSLGLLVQDREGFEEEQAQQPDRADAILEEHLSALLTVLKSKPTSMDVGRILADNLYCNLRIVFPSFGSTA